MTYKHPKMKSKGIKLNDEWLIQVWKDSQHVETIGEPGNTTWGQPMKQAEARKKIEELQRTERYAEHNLIAVRR
jgi:hypothetical protein